MTCGLSIGPLVTNRLLNRQAITRKCLHQGQGRLAHYFFLLRKLFLAYGYLWLLMPKNITYVLKNN